MAEKAEKQNTDAASVKQICYLYAPLLQRFRGNLKKNVGSSAQTWIPFECSLLFRYEFATLTTHTRYIFVAILLYCGMRGVDEIPIDTAFLANALAVDARTIPKSLEELQNCGLLLERKKEREEKKEQTDRQKESAGACVSVSDVNSFSETDADEEKTGNENGLSNIDSAATPQLAKIFESENSNANRWNKKPHGSRSKFSIEECLKYVELCKLDGDSIQNPKALANHLSKTGEADALIFNKLFPKEAAVFAAQSFGEPVKFSDEPCRVCFGAKMADADGKGHRACVHCWNERGKSTGKEPKGEE